MKEWLSRLPRRSAWVLAVALGNMIPGHAQQLHFSLVDRAVIEQRVRDVPVKNTDREVRIKSLFSAVGCAGSLTEQPVKHSKLPNVLCLLPGETDQVIIVGAHYDQISPAQGIIDNWSGASLLASLYQALKSEKRQHSFLFIAFTDEEQGLVGSGFYADHMTRDQVARTRAMVNVDSLGMAPTKVWVHHADYQLVTALSTVSHAMNLPLAEVDVERVGRADSDSFTYRHIPRVTIHSVTQENLRVLHSDRDTVKQFHFNDYYDSYRLRAGYLAYLDQMLSFGRATTLEKWLSK